MMTRSKILLLVFVVIAFAFAGYYLSKYSNKSTEPTPVEEVRLPMQISITDEEIKEENFTGNRPRISGDSLLARSAEEYINQTVAEFKERADTEVPELRKTFGVESPPASYTIDIRAEKVSGENTESIVLSVYSYTGGAHGSSLYKTITANKNGDKILTLADVIKPDQQGKFAALIIDRLLVQSKTGTLPVFEQDVEVLTFKSFQNWAIDQDNLIVYFNQYEIGPGALGSFSFPIPLSELGDILSD